MWRVTAIWRVTSKLSKYTNVYQSYHEVLQARSHQSHMNDNIRDMKNREATKQSMLPDTSTCVVDHNEGLSKDSVTYYVTKTDEKSIPMSCDRARAEAIHAPRIENLPGLIPYKKTSSLFKKDKVIRKCVVHYLNKDVPSSSELRKCLSLVFVLEHIISLYLNRNSDVTIFESRIF